MHSVIPDRLYRQILRVMPIACVDLLVFDQVGQILLVRRNNEPVKGQWWFPGGRVWFGEMREAAARRKLKEECGIDAKLVKEFGTYDVILPVKGSFVHAVSTVYRLSVAQDSRVILDQQSSEFRWRSVEDWLKDPIDDFVRGILKQEIH
ncbi:MAG: NUDIX hydrolase [Candidatus Omnitrophica bacterium]|nr:NUDIX hydrolase [Candidatus Omnitrophota bacterium]